MGCLMNLRSHAPMTDAQNTLKASTEFTSAPAGSEAQKDQQNNQLAVIKPTCALSIDNKLLAQKTEDQPRTELVTKFVDFSSKYGLGYCLSNGSYGVHFNDSTKIILHPNLFHFDYIERPKQANPPVYTSNG